MSICNVFVNDDHALVAVDTEGEHLDGTYQECNKLVVLPLQNTVVAFRGTSLLFTVVSAMLLGPGAKDYDGLADSIPGMITHAMAQLRQMGANTKAIGPAEFLAVGHSLAKGRILGSAFEHRPGSQLKTTPVTQQWYSPFFGVESIQQLGIVADRDGLTALALDQVRRVRENPMPGSTAGGRLIIAEVRKGSITCDEACVLPSRT
ncbi:MAG: hypothetical protein FIB06_01580 [Betaproteobacteria bacterium]|nr:hypothetical protein [Betaproteobacteria bacterium]